MTKFFKSPKWTATCLIAVDFYARLDLDWVHNTGALPFNLRQPFHCGHCSALQDHVYARGTCFLPTHEPPLAVGQYWHQRLLGSFLPQTTFLKRGWNTVLLISLWYNAQRERTKREKKKRVKKRKRKNILRVSSALCCLIALLYLHDSYSQCEWVDHPGTVWNLTQPSYR